VTQFGPGACESEAVGRVLHIVEAFEGGVARHVLDLLEGLPRWQQFAILSLNRRGTRTHEIERARRALGTTCSSPGEIGPGSNRPIAPNNRLAIIPMARGIRPAADLVALLRIRAQIRAVQPNIVHCHSARAGFIGRAAAATTAARVKVYTPHALPFHPGMSGYRSRFYQALERLASRWTDCLVAVSKREQEAVRRAGLRAHDVVIPNGVRLPAIDTDARLRARRILGVATERPLVLCVGRLSRQKSPEDWIQAAELTLARRPEVLFVWVGDGELRTHAEMAARKQLPPGSAWLAGHLDNVSAFYHAADVFMLASLWEGCPYSLLDAMAFGLPSVVTTVCGDLIHCGLNGLTSPPAEPLALSANLLKLLEDPDRARGMGLAAREAARRDFGLEGFLAAHDRLYSELAGR
jgi:glycosyltransferase involved in cell wall biosynthesis